MKRLCVDELSLAGLKLITRLPITDERGHLTRLFCSEELFEAGWDAPIVQINHTSTIVRGTVRGLHYQAAPHVEMKLVTCIRGSIWDVAIDLRAGSNTFLKWHAQELSSENRRALLIPAGFAHGFQALTDNAELIYLHSSKHHASAEAGLNAADLTLNIKWPLEITSLSLRDKNLPFLSAGYTGIALK
jgi:dTDP-4-dehydrorhamnose 3,5-epimerase